MPMKSCRSSVLRAMSLRVCVGSSGGSLGCAFGGVRLAGDPDLKWGMEFVNLRSVNEMPEWHSQLSLWANVSVGH